MKAKLEVKQPKVKAKIRAGTDYWCPIVKAKIRAGTDFYWCVPLRERVVNGIIVPDNAMDETNPLEGIIVAVGSGLREGGVITPLEFKVGDHVRFPKHAGTVVHLRETEETFFVLRENQVFGAIE